MVVNTLKNKSVLKGLTPKLEFIPASPTKHALKIALYYLSVFSQV